MEFPTDSQRWAHRLPDWPAAAVAGLAAGAVLMVLELVWAILIVGTEPWRTSHMIAAIVVGPDALEVRDFSVRLIAIALATHYVLGVVFGLVLAALIAPFRLDARVDLVLLAGAAFGLALYLLNFYGMVVVFPWFAEARGGAAVLAHLVFGMSAAVIYRRLEWSGPEMPDTTRGM
jgi:hypothetical protein